MYNILTCTRFAVWSVRGSQMHTDDFDDGSKLVQRVAYVFFWKIFGNVKYINGEGLLRSTRYDYLKENGYKSQIDHQLILNWLTFL